jgi:hypothetical protein
MVEETGLAMLQRDVNNSLHAVGRSALTNCRHFVSSVSLTKGKVMSDKRTVPLTDDQFDRLWKERRCVDQLGEIIGIAIVQAAEEAAEKDVSFWNVVRKLAEAEKDDKVVVDWVNREIVVKDKMESALDDEFSE